MRGLGTRRGLFATQLDLASAAVDLTNRRLLGVQLGRRSL